MIEDEEQLHVTRERIASRIDLLARLRISRRPEDLRRCIDNRSPPEDVAPQRAARRQPAEGYGRGTG